MAKLSASHTFANGASAEVKLDLENDYPDCLAEAVKTLGSAMREVLISVSLMDDEDDGEA